MGRKVVIIFLLILSTCAYTTTEVVVSVPQVESLYSSWSEQAFCLSADHSYAYNIIRGGWMSVDMPICAQSDIPVHTHPWWGEDFPNALDWYEWQLYKSRYGNTTFGLMLDQRTIKLYRR